MVRPSRRLPWAATFVFAGGLLAVAACHRGEGPSAPEARPSRVAWVDEPLAEIDVSQERARFLAWRRSGQAADAVARLDRLLDLFDAARFARVEDVRARAREALWAELGAPPEGARGAPATHAAVTRLYEVAVRVESLLPEPRATATSVREGKRADPSTSDPSPRDEWQETRSFVADAVQLLATDTFTPRTAEELAVRALVQRTLSERGHPRIADNARWRRHDHVVATLEATITAPARHRAAIGRIVDWDTADDPIPTLRHGDDAPLPTPAEIDVWLALVDTHRAALLAEPKWRGIVDEWATADAALAARVRAGVPAALSEHHAVPTVRGLELSPLAAAPRVVVFATGQVAMDGGARPDAMGPRGQDSPATQAMEPLVQELRSALLAMGADSVVLAVEADAPPKALRVALDAIAAAGASEVEFVLRDEVGGKVGVIVVPLVSQRSAGPLRRAVEVATWSGRISAGGIDLELHVRRDGRLLGTLASGVTPASHLEARWQQITKAFPRAAVMPVQLADDASLADLVGVLRLSRTHQQDGSAGVAPRESSTTSATTPVLVLDYTATALPPEPGSKAAPSLPRPPRVVDADAFDRLLAARAAKIGGSSAAVQPSIPLPPGDASRLERVANGLVACTGELVPAPTVSGRGKAARVVTGDAARPTSISVLLPFWDGRVDKSRPLDVVITPKPTAPERAALTSCVEASLLGVALASQRDPVEVTLTVSAP